MTEKNKKPFQDLGETHDHEEQLRADSMALIRADAELSKRLVIVEKAMTLIFAYTIEHTAATALRRSDMASRR